MEGARLSIPPPLMGLFANTSLDVPAEEFVVASVSLGDWPKLPDLMKAMGGSFLSFSLDPDEITVVTTNENWMSVGSRLATSRVEKGYKLIRMSAPLHFDVVGYLLTVCQAMYDKRISLYAISTFHRDNILVKRENLDAALGALRELISAASRDLRRR